VLVGETLIEYINIPVLDEAMGQTPVERADAEALLQALVADHSGRVNCQS
jgi:hypothetical protein